jgi:mono/diheme cytochrome c family protein
MRIFIFALSASLLACQKGADDVDTTDLTEDLAAGEDLYVSDCSGCHGADATGIVGPNILDESASAITTAIMEGKGSMPAFPDYTDQEILNVISYIGTL